MNQQQSSPSNGDSDSLKAFLVKRRWSIKLQDAIVGLGLVGALSAIYLFDNLWASTPDNKRPPKKVVSEPAPVPTKDTNTARTLAVTKSDNTFDRIGRILDTLGKGYSYTRIPMAKLKRREALQEYDILFITCGTVPESWGKNALSDETRFN